MIACFGAWRDTGDYTQVSLLQQDGTSKRELVCWLPAADAQRAKDSAVEISLKGQEGRWKIAAIYGTKPKHFITDNKMDKASFDREDGWTW